MEEKNKTLSKDEIISKFATARREFNKKRDTPYLYALSEENEKRFKELEIFKGVSLSFLNGWADLMYNLGKDITEVCKLANGELPFISYINSKYSTLRVDYYFKSGVKVPKIVEKLIDSLIYKVEDDSYMICEYCGSNGTEDIAEDGTFFTKSCDRCKKTENENLNEEKSILRGAVNKQNWYADELLEEVTNIQKNVKNRDIDVDNYLNFLDKTVALIEKIKLKVDENEFVDFNAEDYSFNEFEKYANQKRFSKSFIIRKYLSTMNKQDIHTLCSKFGKDRVIKELNYEYKEMFKFGFIDIKGMIIALTGNYKEYGVFKEILEIIESYEENE